MPPQPDQAELSDVEKLLGDLGSANQTPPRRPLWLFAALALSIIVALLLIPFAARSFMFPLTEKGECLALYQQKCISLSTAEITETFSVTLPTSAEVIDSGSNGFLLTESKYAIVAVDAEQVPLVLDGYEPYNGGSPLPMLKDFGFESVSQELVREDRGSTAFVGTNSQGDTLIYLIWSLD